MSFRPFTLIEPSAAPAPLVVDSPHSGRIYPADFAYVCPLPLLRQTEDSYVDELVSGAAEAGAVVLMAEFPRSYMDVNRAEDDIDPALLAESWPHPLNPSERTLQGLGLVRRLCKSGIPVYGAPLGVAEVKRRIETLYRPYHAALDNAVARRMKFFGTCYLLNCHSMPAHSGDKTGDRSAARRPDFVLGDRSGTSCDPAFTRLASHLLQDMGYSVALNDPYKGMEIVRRHGNPRAGKHALQVEINRRLYMNEDTLEKHEGFVRLRARLSEFFTSLAAELARQMPDRQAAE